MAVKIDKRYVRYGIILAVAGGAYLLYRWYQNKQAANNTTTSGDTGTGTGEGTNLNSVLTGLSASSDNSGVTYEGAAPTINVSEPSSVNSGNTNSTTGNTTTTTTNPATATQPASSTGTPVATSKAPVPAMPSGVKVTKTTSNSVTVTWNKVTGATSYRVRVTYQGKLVSQQTTGGTSVTIGGLGADHTYTIHVAASNASGMSAETNGPSAKTAKS